MATIDIAQNANFQEQLIREIASKFVVPEDFLKEISKKALTMIDGVMTAVTKQKVTEKREPQGLIGSLVKPVMDASSSVAALPQPTTEKKFLQEQEKPKVVLIGGFTEQGIRDLKDKLPAILEGSFKKMSLQKEQPTLGQKFAEGGLLGLIPKEILPIIGGATAILTGLGALIAAFQTQGPAKGTLELIGKAGLKGGLILLAKRIFGTSLKIALKRIPIIGTLISYGFAIQRFNNGDTVGGILDLVSGTVGLLDLVAPGLGTVLGLGVDILQAVLDAKAGGSSAEASAKKTDILKDWAKQIGPMLMKAVPYLPVIGPLVDAGKAISEGKWLDAAYHMVRAIPGMQYVIDILDYFTGGKTQEIIKGGIVDVGTWFANMGVWIAEKIKEIPFINSLGRVIEHLQSGNYLEALKSLGHSVPFLGSILDWLGVKETNAAGEAIDDTNLQQAFNLMEKLKTWIKDNIVEKITGWFTNIYDWGKEKAKGVLSTIGNLFEDTSETVRTVTPMADGGIVTEPIKAIVGEAGPEAVIPLEKYFDPKQFTLSNTTLEQIASNTNNTNQSLKVLGEAILKLAQIFDKKITANNNGKNIVIAGQQQANQYPSASQIAATNIDPIRQVRMQFAI